MKKTASMLGSEFVRLTRTRMGKASILGLTVIPLLYSGMLIGAFWDPYGKLDQLPVAVVNADAGAVADGKQVDAGRDLVDELKRNPEFEWAFTDEKTAMEGLKDHRYAMAFVIPGDFSASTATLKDESPKLAEISYYVDDGWNYLNSRIGEAASEKLKTDVSREVTKAYASAVLESVGDAAKGLEEASDGAAELADGAKAARSGAEELHDNLAKLADGSLQLKQGFGKLSAGSASLAEGAGEVSKGSERLADGLASAVQGENRLSEGAGKADDAAAQLAVGAEAVKSGGAGLSAGASELKAGNAGVAEGAKRLSESLSSYAEAHEDASSDPAFKQLLAAAEQLSAGAAKAEQGASEVAAGASELAAAQDRLASGASALQEGTGELRAGMETFGGKLGELAEGASRLTAGSAALSAGAGELRAGIGNAGQAASSVSDGSHRLADGSQSLTSGIGKLTEGSSVLSGKLGDASDDARALSGGGDAQASRFAEPVAIDEHKLADIPNYGTGMTPYFLSLGLYVGILLSTVILPLRDAAANMDSGWKWYLSKALMFGSIAVFQTVIVDSVLLFGFGLEVSDVALFYGATIAISLTFMAILHLFVASADLVGRFLAVLLLTLQLAASAGTYPAELLPAWLQAIGPWLPMTHAITALRYVVAGGNLGGAGQELLILGAYAVASVGMTVLVFSRKFRQGRMEIAAAAA